MKIPLSLLAADAKPFDVVGFGENSLDLVTVVASHPEPNSKVQLQTLAYLQGGQVATATAACARLGLAARYVGTFGDDAQGADGVESLRREGVDTTFAIRVAGATSRVAIVIVDQRRGQRTVMWHRHPGLIRPVESVPREAMQSGRILLVDAEDVAAATHAAEMAREAGAIVVVDVDGVRPGVAALLDRVDVIITAESFPRSLTGIDDTGAALADLARRFDRAKVVCATLGERGSLARCDGVEVRTPAWPIHCVDSTGAGDLFRAGFIAGWVKEGSGANLEAVLRYANAAAALNCRAVGARTASPRPHEVEELLHSK